VINVASPLWRDWSAMLRESIEPVRRSLREFLTEDIYLPDGPFKGERFTFKRQPFTGLLVDEIDAARWVEIFVAGPSQSGKTLIAHVVPPVYICAELRRNVVIAMPDMRMVTNKWTVDYLPVFEHSPKLRGLLPTNGPGSRGGTIKDTVRLANGAIIKFMTAGGDDTARAGFTAEGGVYATEAARFSHAGKASVESDPLDQLRARMQAMGRRLRRMIVEGTLTTEDEYPWRARVQSTQSRILTQCPHCGDWNSPERQHLVGWEDAGSEIEAAEKAWWGCPACGQEITADERIAANQSARLVHLGQSIDKRGRLVGDPPKTERLWFHWSAWHNLLLSAADIAPDLWKAARLDPETEEADLAERKLSQFVFSVPYSPPDLVIEALAAGDVSARAGELPKGQLPADTQWLTVFCDVGMYELHWVAGAWRSSHVGHIPDYETIGVLKRGEGETAVERRRAVESRLQEALDELAKRCEIGWMLGSTRKTPDRILIDAGWLTDIVHQWCRKRGSPFFAAIGRGTGQRAGHSYSHPTRKTREVRYIGDQYHVRRHAKHRTLYFVMDSDYWKSRVHRSLRVDADEPGSVSLYRDAQHQHKTYERHLLAERLARRPHVRHGSVEVWENPQDKPNHYLDATYGCLVGGHHAGFRFDGRPSPPVAQALGFQGAAPAATAPRKWFQR